MSAQRCATCEAGVIVVCAILTLVVLSITGFPPKGSRPGLWIKGDVTSTPVDWSFASKYQTITVETHPWYLIPHSVTMFFVTYKGNLYLHADYVNPGDKWPSGKSWTAAVARNSKVRIKLGEQVFDGRAVMATDPAEFEGCLNVFRKKYPKSRFSDPNRPPGDQWFLRMEPD